MTSFPIDLGAYKRISLDASNPQLTDEQRDALKANIELCRDAIVFFLPLREPPGALVAIPVAPTTLSPR